MEIKIKKGLDLHLAGAVTPGTAIADVRPSVVAICPEDFPGFTPKAEVTAGQSVQRGSALLYDKNHPELKLVSPGAGTVREVVRGERRRILRVEVEVPLADSAVTFPPATTPDALRKLLANSGLMAMMRRRPYDIVPNPDDKVRDIFVTACHTAPLEVPVAVPEAPELALAEKAVAALGTLTEGKVYISYAAGTPWPAVGKAEMVAVSGPHPAGNAGVQIANIRPINKGEVVWTLDWDVLLRIGRLLTDGTVDTTVTVAITGPEVAKPGLVRTVAGAQIAPLLEGRLSQDSRSKRIISGNVLTGHAVGDGPDAFLRAPYRQITVIAEGDDVDEFMGWASMKPSKLSTSPSFPLSFFHKIFRPDARLNGGRRAMIMSGQYDRMMPMDILPEYLIKAILSKDIEKMEELGIYEVAPEDFALAEFADTSKLPLQQIVRTGLDYLRKELE